MADTPELNGPSAVDMTGMLSLWAVRTVSDMEEPSKTEIEGGTRITYSFTPDGYSFDVTVDKIVDDRLTIPIATEALGRSTAAFADFIYVDSQDTVSAAQTIAAGGTWYIVERRNVPQTKVIADSDAVRVYKVSLQPAVPGTTGGDGKFTLKQGVAVQAFTTQPVYVGGVSPTSP